MSKYFSINIGRQLGSGGRQIGRQLAEKMNISYYDKELIALASKESGLAKEFFEEADEKASFSLFGGLFGLRASILDEGFVNNYLCNETLFKIQSDVIKDLAKKQSCVFVGRCADYVLREQEAAVNLFISADWDDRIKRIAQKHELTTEKTKEMIERTDKKRANYYNFYSNKQWGAASSYHLCINSSILGIDDTVTFIEEFVKKRLKIFL